MARIYLCKPFHEASYPDESILPCAIDHVLNCQKPVLTLLLHRLMLALVVMVSERPRSSQHT